MKRIVFFVALVASVMGLKAQNCEALVLPYFNGNASAMAEYPQEKIDWLCAFARAAFYESDTVPAGAEMCPLSEVESKVDGRHLTDGLAVELTTLSFYAFNFSEIQQRYNNPDVIVCFRTPDSKHPYLVMRSENEMHVLANNAHN